MMMMPLKQNFLTNSNKLATQQNQQHSKNNKNKKKLKTVTETVTDIKPTVQEEIMRQLMQ